MQPILLQIGLCPAALPMPSSPQRAKENIGPAPVAGHRELLGWLAAHAGQKSF